MPISYYQSRDKRQTDWFLLVLFLILVAVGYSAIFSAQFSEEIPSIFEDFKGFVKTSPGRQLVWVGVSLSTAFIVQLIDRKFFNHLAPVIYVGAIFALILVLIFGHNAGGGQSWLKLGSVRIQPSEFAKFSTALMVAWYLSQIKSDVRSLKGKLITAIIILIPLGFIILQNDTGTALVFTSFIFVLYREGLSNYYMIAIASAIILALLTLLLNNYWIILVGISLVTLIYSILKYLPSWIEAIVVLAIGSALILASEYLPSLVFLGIVLASIVLSLIGYFYSRQSFLVLISVMFFAISYTQSVKYVFTEVLRDYQQARIEIFLGQKSDPRGAEYQVNQAKMAICSGETTGKGYLNGSFTKGNFVPDQSTDFIFSTVCEEFGFVGAGGLIILYLFIMFRIIIIAERQPAKFTRIYAYSAMGIFFMHFWINIGMTIGLMPVIGIPLPAMSYGGSSLLGFTLLIAILIRLDADRGNYSR